MKRTYKMILAAAAGYILGSAILHFTPFWVGIVIALVFIVLIVVTPDE
jgi:hypothetical protein